MRFIRRLRRDLIERGRSVDSIIRRYEESVLPMYQEFVHPSNRHADVIIPGGLCHAASDVVAPARILAHLVRRGTDPRAGPWAGAAARE